MFKLFRIVMVTMLCGVLMHSDLLAQEAQKKMSINVTDASTSAALSNVQIKWMTYGNTGQQRGDAYTNEEGFATLPIPAKGYQVFQLMFSRDGFVPVRASWPDRGNDGMTGTAEPPESYELVMEPARTIGGKVVDETGQPVNGASVVLSLYKKLEAPNSSIDINWKTIKTKEDGTWKLDNAPSSIDRANFAVYHPQYSNSAEGFFNYENHPNPKELVDGTSVYTLSHGVPLEVTVTDEAGKPIPGAKLGWGTDRVASNVIPETTTDANGKYIFGAKPEINATITVKAKGYAPDLKVVTVGKDKATAEFKLKAPKTISGKVVDSSGNPVKGGRLYVDSWRGSRTLGQSINISSNGTFSWKEAPEDEVLVDILPNGGGARRRVPMKATGEEVVLSVTGGLSVHGKVVDAVTGKPIEKFRAIQGIVFDSNQPPSWMGRQGQNGANGEFTLRFDEQYPGYIVRIDADGYKRALSRQIKPDEGKVELEFKLEKGKSVVGVVKDVDGKPLSGARVIVATHSQTAYIQNGRDVNRQGNDEAVTDDQGKYTLPDQSDPYAIVVITDTGYATVQQKELSASGEIQLQPWGKVEGTLSLSGKLAGAGENINLNVNESMVMDAQTPRIYFAYQTRTDGSGRFTFDRVPAGKGSATRMIETSSGQMRMMRSTHNARFDLEAGKTINVQLGGTGRPIIGKLNLPADKIKGRRTTFTQSDLHTPYPQMQADLMKKVQAMKPEDQQKYFQEWMNTDEGKEYQKKMLEYSQTAVNFGIDVKPDGTFRADDIPPGKYEIGIFLNELSDAQNPWNGAPLARLTKIIEVAGGTTPEPLDLGTLEVEWVEQQ